VTPATPADRPDLLSIAFDAAAGRVAATTARDTDACRSLATGLRYLPFARRIVALGRLIETSPRCPPATLRRAEALFRAPRVSVKAVIWQLLFDSWEGAVPALRGPGRPRFLRIAGENGSLHVEVIEAAGGDTTLRGTLDGPRSDVALELTPEGIPAIRVPVEPGGTFETTVPAGTPPFSIAVRVGRRIVARTDRLPPTLLARA
jgi:hypothetical protein